MDLEIHKAIGFCRPKKRKIKKFPSKAIACVTTGNNVASGWYKKTNACSLLHDIGYIIIDEAGNPISQIELQDEENITYNSRIPDDSERFKKGG